MADDALGSLNNHEISLIYYRMVEYKKSLDKVINDRVMIKMVMIPGLGTVPAGKPITEADAELIQNSDYYRHLGNLIKKLKRYVEVVEEANPEIKNAARYIG